MGVRFGLDGERSEFAPHAHPFAGAGTTWTTRYPRAFSSRSRAGTMAAVWSWVSWSRKMPRPRASMRSSDS